MTFVEAIKSVYRNYAQFKGRARRKEFWYFVLYYFLVFVLIANISDYLTFSNPNFDNFIGLVLGLIIFGHMLPILALISRRLHDVGKSGTYIFLWLIPLVGPIMILIAFFTDSEYGDNKYGYNPKTGISQDDLDAIGNN